MLYELLERIPTESKPVTVRRPLPAVPYPRIVQHHRLDFLKNGEAAVIEVIDYGVLLEYLVRDVGGVRRADDELALAERHRIVDRAGEPVVYTHHEGIHEVVECRGYWLVVGAPSLAETARARIQILFDPLLEQDIVDMVRADRLVGELAAPVCDLFLHSHGPNTKESAATAAWNLTGPCAGVVDARAARYQAEPSEVADPCCCVPRCREVKVAVRVCPTGEQVSGSGQIRRYDVRPG